MPKTATARTVMRMARRSVLRVVLWCNIQTPPKLKFGNSNECGAGLVYQFSQLINRSNSEFLKRYPSIFHCCREATVSSDDSIQLWDDRLRLNLPQPAANLRHSVGICGGFPSLLA